MGSFYRMDSMRSAPFGSFINAPSHNGTRWDPRDNMLRPKMVSNGSFLQLSTMNERSRLGSMRRRPSYSAHSTGGAGNAENAFGSFYQGRPSQLGPNTRSNMSSAYGNMSCASGQGFFRSNSMQRIPSSIRARSLGSSFMQVASDAGSDKGLYSTGSFLQPSFNFNSFHNGMSCMDDQAAMANRTAAMPHCNPFLMPQYAVNTLRDSDEDNTQQALQRYDSSNALQRHYSICGQFHNYSNDFPNSNMGGRGFFRRFYNMIPMLRANVAGFSFNPSVRQQAPAGLGSHAAPPPVFQSSQEQLQLQSRVKPQSQSQPKAQPQPQPQPRKQPPIMKNQQETSQQASPPQQRTLAKKGSKQSDDSTINSSNAPDQLTRQSSASTIKRHDSRKRIGMYFKQTSSDKEVTGYIKNNTSSSDKASPSRQKDPSLVNPIKPILLFEASADMTNDGVEIDKRTVSYKKNNNEVHKYDMHDIIHVKRNFDRSIHGSSLSEIRNYFVSGANVGMLLADAGYSTTDPTSWFSWLALREVVRGTFTKLGESSLLTMSACFLQDDQVLDLLAEAPRSFAPLIVAESPLFGNVANGLIYTTLDRASTFDDTLQTCLERAKEQIGNSNEEEQGIVLVTCVLRQVRISRSTGNKDILVSSIFASGVGNGIIHYNRILDKNPAEPRALFYSTLHRTVHSTAIFLCNSDNPKIYSFLNTLQRFTTILTRNPKPNSVNVFVLFAESTIKKVKEDISKATDPRQVVTMERFLKRMEVMLEDSKAMLENPESAVPKTYI